MKLSKYLYLLSFPFSFFLLTACEDEIDVELDEGASQLVVDAFLTNDSSVQSLKMSKTAPYFLNEATEGVDGLNPVVYGPNGQQFVFQSAGKGNYTYDPKINGALDSIGFRYRLEFNYKDQLFTATSLLNPVPPVDSMTYAFEEEELGAEEGYYSQFWARDFAGTKDFYWIRAFKNGTELREDDPASLILSEDAAFGGNGADGFIFILPLRAAITDGDDPLAVGDVSSVELYSLNEEIFEFLDQLTIQANNGGLFSTPPANIRSNIRDANGNLQDQVLGVFSLSAISSASIQIQE